MYCVVPMSEAYAREIACWQYPGAYAIYSLQPSEEAAGGADGWQLLRLPDGGGDADGLFLLWAVGPHPVKPGAAGAVSAGLPGLWPWDEPRAAAKGREPPSCRQALHLPPRPSRPGSCGWWWPPLTGGRFTCIKSLALSARHRSPTCAPASRLS